MVCIVYFVVHQPHESQLDNSSFSLFFATTCGMWDFPQPGIEPRPTTLEVWMPLAHQGSPEIIKTDELGQLFSTGVSFAFLGDIQQCLEILSKLGRGYYWHLVVEDTTNSQNWPGGITGIQWVEDTTNSSIMHRIAICHQKFQERYIKHLLLKLEKTPCQKQNRLDLHLKQFVSFREFF